MRRMRKVIREWVGPRCSKPGSSISMSGMTEAKRRREMLVSTFRCLPAALPVRYPKAKCPTAYIFLFSVNVMGSFCYSGGIKGFVLSNR